VSRIRQTTRAQRRAHERKGPWLWRESTSHTQAHRHTGTQSTEPPTVKRVSAAGQSCEQVGVRSLAFQRSSEHGGFTRRCTLSCRKERTRRIAKGLLESIAISQIASLTRTAGVGALHSTHNRICYRSSQALNNYPNVDSGVHHGVSYILALS
jgi:hypothetical protein